MSISLEDKKKFYAMVKVVEIMNRELKLTESARKFYEEEGFSLVKSLANIKKELCNMVMYGDIENLDIEGLISPYVVLWHWEK